MAANHVFDQQTDRSGQVFYRLGNLYGVPDYLKQANVGNYIGVKQASLQLNGFADPQNRRYPIADPTSTWLSSLYFADNKTAYHPKTAKHIEQRLLKAAQHHRVKNAVDTVFTKHATMQTDDLDARPDTDFGFVQEFEDGKKSRHLPLRNSLEVKTAADYLHKHQTTFPYDHRRKIATKIMLKAAETGANLGDKEQYIERQSGRGMCNPIKVAAMFRDRARIINKKYAGDPEALRESFNKMAEAIETTPSHCLGPEHLEKIAEMIDNFDRESGLIHHYGEIIKAPEDVLFEVTYKQASEVSEALVSMQNGSIYEKNDFSKLSVDDVETLFGTEIANEVRTGMDVDPEKMAEIASTFPRADAQLLDTLMSETGVHPRAKQASAQPVGFDPTQLAVFANQFTAAGS